MSCVSLTVDQQAVLDQLAAQDGIGPVDPELTEAVEVLREWRWIFGPGPELTGTGWRHAHHEKRPGILESAAIQYMKPIRMAGEESEEEAGSRFGDAINDFGSFFFQRRLFIPKDIAEQVEALIAEIGRTATSFDIMRQSQQQGWAKPGSVEEWPTLWNKVKDDFPVIRNDIADRFRDLLDPPKSPTRWQRVAERLQFGRSPNKRLRPTVDGESS